MRSQTPFGPIRAAPPPNTFPFARPLQSDHIKPGPLALLRQLVHSIGVWRERVRSRRQLRGLRGLDDHLLRDIGLTREALLLQGVNPVFGYSRKTRRRHWRDAYRALLSQREPQ